MRTTLGTLATLGLCVCATFAGTITVDVNDAGCVSGSGQPDPYAVVYCSIQDAIDDAVAGDQINVAAGTYNEQVRFTESVTVVGSGAVVIDPNGAQFEGPYAGADMVRAAVTFETGCDGAIVQNVTLQNGNASDLNGNAGIEVIDGEIDNVTVRDVVVDGVSGHGFGAYHPDHTWPPGSGWLIEDCSFSTDDTGTWSGMRPENMNDLTIRYCDVGPTNYGGILLVQANVAVVQGCKVHDVQRAGIQVDAYCTDTIDVLENEVWNANIENASGYSDIRLYAGQENPHGNTPATITIEDNVLHDGVNGICAKYGDLSTRTDVVIQGNAFVHHSDYAVLNLATGTLDAENNWWQSADGPEDVDSGTNEVTLATCDSYTVAEMLNAVAENTGELGGAVSDEVDYCPWLDSFPRLTLEADSDCYSVGDTVTVGIWMRDITQTIVGGQFFLRYDNTVLDYLSITTGDPPFTIEVFSDVNEAAGKIDYAVGIPEGGSGTSADTMMAVITFEALTQICSESALIVFRPHNPPSRLGDDTNTPVYPLLVGLDVVDEVAPTATQGTIDTCYATAAEAETAALAATTDPSDNCTDPSDIVISVATVGDCSAAVTVTLTDECGNSSDYVYNTRIDDAAPTATQGTIDACYATPGEAEAAAIAATTDPTDNCSDPSDIVLSAATVGDCSATVTVTVTDECGNFTDYVYNTRVDGTAPTATQGTIDACYDTAAEAETAALAATTDSSDNCTDPGDIVISVATVGDCSAAVTVTLTDECGNSSDYVYNTRIDNTAPTATPGTIDACYATVAEAEAAAIAATADPNDNCSDPADIVLSAVTVGDCSAMVTVTVTDQCGNFTDYVYNTRVDNTAPTATAGTIDTCYASVAEAEAAAIAATTDPTDNCSNPNDIVITAGTVGDCSATVTVSVTDECGNFSIYDYSTRVDGEPPVVTPPADVDVYADAGLCTAVVDPGTATAVDNCTVTLTVTGTRSDALELTDPYPQGVTTITWETTDECGNTGSEFQTVTVSEYNEVVLDIELKAIAEAALTRCITFEFWDCTTQTAETVEQEITFTSGLATAVSVEVPCGVYDCVRARDGLHSLWRTDVDAFGIVGTQYVADFTDASGGGGDDDSLIGGNLFDDVPPYAPPQFVDIMDYAVFINNWAVNYGTGDTTCTTPWPHADLSGDGEVTSADFTFIQTYFLYTDESACCGLLGGGSGPRSQISVAELDELGLPELAVADLNRDGWVDQADIVAFLSGVRPNQPGLIEIVPAATDGEGKAGELLPHAPQPRQP